MSDGITDSVRDELFGPRDSEEDPRYVALRERKIKKIAENIIIDIEERFGVECGIVDFTEKDYLVRLYMTMIKQGL